MSVSYVKHRNSIFDNSLNYICLRKSKRPLSFKKKNTKKNRWSMLWIDVIEHADYWVMNPKIFCLWEAPFRRLYPYKKCLIVYEIQGFITMLFWPPWLLFTVAIIYYSLKTNHSFLSLLILIFFVFSCLEIPNVGEELSPSTCP